MSPYLNTLWLLISPETDHFNLELMLQGMNGGETDWTRTMDKLNRGNTISDRQESTKPNRTQDQLLTDKNTRTQNLKKPDSFLNYKNKQTPNTWQIRTVQQTNIHSKDNIPGNTRHNYY